MFKESQQKEMKIEEYLTEQLFSSERVCPICGGTHVQRNGRRKNGSQKVHLQRLREDIFNTEELDIQRNTQAHVSMARIHGLNQHLAATKTAFTGSFRKAMAIGLYR
jgi:hypothetical protein